LCFTVPCPSLTDPNNGVVTCSLGDDGVSSYEDTCSFSCNTGYKLTGSKTRICQSSGSWSGSKTMCNGGEIHCAVLSYLYIGDQEMATMFKRLKIYCNHLFAAIFYTTF